MKKKTTMQKTEINYAGLQREIDKALREANHFWWGCVIGIAYGSRVDTIRINEKEEPTANDFVPVVRVKYLSPYDSNVKSRVVKWYDKNVKSEYLKTINNEK